VFSGQEDVDLNGLVDASRLGFLSSNNQIRIERINGTSLIHEKSPTSLLSLSIKTLFANIDTTQPNQTIETKMVVASDVTKDTIYLKIKVPGYPDKIVMLPKHPNRGIHIRTTNR